MFNDIPIIDQIESIDELQEVITRNVIALVKVRATRVVGLPIRTIN